jgi:hypothetical protein
MNVVLYLAILAWGLIIGLLVLVVTGKISNKTYYTIAYSGMTVVLAIATLVSLGFAALNFVDLVFLGRFGHSAWSIVVMLFFTVVAGAATRWAAILLKGARAT